MLVKISNFIIDPPWPRVNVVRGATRTSRGMPLEFETMTVSSIFELLDRDIFSRATDPHCVWLWVFDRFLTETELEMTNRGYRRHARIVWNKGRGIAPAFTIRFVHEYVIWFYKARFPKVSPLARSRFTTVITERPREHARKPDALYAMVEALYPDGRRMDVFSREKRKGWLQYGDQMGKYEGA